MIKLVIVYDIADIKTNNNIRHYLKTIGFNIQKSVFEVHTDYKNINKISQKLTELLGDNGSIILYNLGSINRDNTIRIGNNALGEAIDNNYIII